MTTSVQNVSSLISSYKPTAQATGGVSSSFSDFLYKSEDSKVQPTSSAKISQQSTDAEALFTESHTIKFYHTDGTYTTFPPMDAPENVKRAWQTATKNISEMDVATLAMNFQPPSNDTAIDPKYLPEGMKAQHNDYTPLTDTNSYIEKTKEVIYGAKFSSKFAQPWQIDTWKNQISSLENFLSNLQQSA